jgi:phage tail-like protein
MPARATDPVIGFSFALEVQGKVTGYFTEIGGLGSETEVVEHKVVDPQGHDLIQKIPGRKKYTDMTLKRGVTALKDIWDWRKMVEDGNIVGARAHGTVTMFDQSLQPVAKWSFTNGWPTKVSGPSISSDSNAFGVEEVTICFETMTREL